jgi:hypothetical protein
MGVPPAMSPPVAAAYPMRGGIAPTKAPKTRTRASTQRYRHNRLKLKQMIWREMAANTVIRRVG